jgi:hypothetical protein
MIHLLKLPMLENSTNSVACAGASLKHFQMKLYLVDNPDTMLWDFKISFDRVTHILFYCKYKHIQI